jgi:hypothetical protein
MGFLVKKAMESDNYAVSFTRLYQIAFIGVAGKSFKSLLCKRLTVVWALKGQ